MTQGPILTNIVSSLEKCRRDRSPRDYGRLETLYAFRGEHVNFQFVFEYTSDDVWNRRFRVHARCSEPDIKIRTRLVKNVTVDFDTYVSDPSRGTDKILSYPGNSYPDLLLPLSESDFIRPQTGELYAVWCDLDIPNDASGNITVTLEIENESGSSAADSLTVHVTPTELAEADYKCTNWFHVDCLATYYDVPIFSEKHWEIIEKFMTAAVKNGINMILTPIFTPPLDTAIGGERPTVQLVGVEKHADGEYSFDFSKLDRYIELCLRLGVKWLEISHLFSQWGAKYAPKVVATLHEGETVTEKRIFGWDTSGTEGEYPIFLAAFLPKLVAHLKEKGVYERCIFHISDEPNKDTVEGYRRAKAIVDPYLADAYIADACCDASILEGDSVLKYPIPCSNRMDEFTALDLDERWTYYCCSQHDGVVNRFICYPSVRNRILGTQMYKYSLNGFLQWGFNFYYSEHSLREIDPFVDQSGDGWVPAGDTFVVYPGLHGEPYESLRLAVFAEAFYDLRALRTCESIIGRDATLGLIEAGVGEITYKDYPTSPDYILGLRRAVAEKCEEVLSGRKDS